MDEKKYILSITYYDLTHEELRRLRARIHEITGHETNVSFNVTEQKDED